MRTSEISRKTNETDIKISVNLDGDGKYDNDSGCGFLDHMLDLFARNGNFDLQVQCKGDTYVDYHHTVEDIGISLGTAFSDALAKKSGITRYGNMILPMDETLILCAVDLSGRSILCYDAEIPAAKVGDFDTELTEEFLLGFTRALNATIHIKMLAGKNSHHIIEAIFKGLGRALKQAVAIDPNNSKTIPSTKGVL